MRNGYQGAVEVRTTSVSELGQGETFPVSVRYILLSVPNRSAMKDILQTEDNLDNFRDDLRRSNSRISLRLKDKGSAALPCSA